METDATLPERRKLERLEEVLWVTEAQRGDSDAFARLFNRYEKPILYYLRRLVPGGDSALDLHQEVWIDAFRGLASLQIPEAFRVWIYRIAHHKAARYVREEIVQEQGTKAISEQQPENSRPSGDESFDPEAIHEALTALPPHQREILVLHYLRDLSVAELGAVLSCPAGTIKSRLYHARLALRRVIERKIL